MSATVEDILKKNGFENFGFTESTPTSFEYYEEWLKNNYHGEMAFLQEHAFVKADPTRVLSVARSSIVVTKSYVPHPHPRSFDLPIAAYARGEDYHEWMLTRLIETSQELKAALPNEAFYAFVDSMPILERDFAWRAGLGWIGKNGCLINQNRGSYEFIGGILTSMSFAKPVIAADRCGTCTKCIDACPTGAIVAEKQIDANLCISYLTIETKSNPAPGLRDKIDSYFGCDICQQVCPWNRAIEIEQNIEPVNLVDQLRMILTSSNKIIEAHFAGTPLLRTFANGHRRNAILVAANKNLSELRPEIAAYLTHSRLGELSQWALNKLGGAAPSFILEPSFDSFSPSYDERGPHA